MGFKIWQRYLLVRLAKTVLFFLFLIYACYTLIDHSIHIKEFQSPSLSFIRVSHYHLAQFSKRLDLFLPLALLLAIIRVFSQLHLLNELVPLLLGRISRLSVFLLFFSFSAATASLLYINVEFLQPQMQAYIDYFEQCHFSRNDWSVQTNQSRFVDLAQGERLYYFAYDSKNFLCTDVYWIKSKDHILHMEKVQFRENQPAMGYCIDELVRNRQGTLQLLSSQKSQSFPLLNLSSIASLQQQTLPLHLSLSELHRQKNQHALHSRLTRQDIVACFHYKLASPLLALLSVLFPIMTCLYTRKRRLSFFALTGGYLFILFTLFVLFHSCFILARFRLPHPAFILWTPLCFLASFFLHKLHRHQKSN